jgi:hypothetical protein
MEEAKAETSHDTVVEKSNYMETAVKESNFLFLRGKGHTQRLGRERDLRRTQTILPRQRFFIYIFIYSRKA